MVFLPSNGFPMSLESEDMINPAHPTLTQILQAHRPGFKHTGLLWGLEQVTLQSLHFLVTNNNSPGHHQVVSTSQHT